MKEFNNVKEWLLKGDPSIRFQTMKDLQNVAPEIFEKERQKISHSGWGAKLLSLQDKEGTWAQALYSPKWISTTYTLLQLRRIGLDPNHENAQRGARILLDKGFFKDGGINYWKSWKHSETCVTGMILSILAYFNVKDERLHEMFDFLRIEQMPDMGWNCESFRGAKHSSFHTTLSVLEGILLFATLYPNVKQEVDTLISEGFEFLLQHKLFKSDKTGNVVDTKMTRFAFPPRWRYDVMKALDLAQEIKHPKDPRFKDAIELLKSKQNDDGTWNLQSKHGGKIFFEMEQVGKPSQWNTLRALRILKWWDSMNNN